MKIKKVANIIVVFMWIISLVFAIIWFFNFPFRYEPEPLTVICSLISIAVTGLVKFYSAALDRENFSAAHVLAKGYVNNFIEPVVTQLLKDSAKGEKPLFCIFIPDSLCDLDVKSIDRFKKKLVDKGLLHNTKGVKLSEERGIRDVMTISNSKYPNLYFDFPNTMRSLNDYIDYKLESNKDSLNTEQRNKLGKKYIEHFKEQLIESLKEKSLYPEYVKFTDYNFEIN